MTKAERLKKAEAAHEAHFGKGCPYCQRAVWDVTYPGCPIALDLIQEVYRLRGRR